MGASRTKPSAQGVSTHQYTLYTRYIVAKKTERRGERGREGEEREREGGRRERERGRETEGEETERDRVRREGGRKEGETCKHKSLPYVEF